MAKHVNGLTGKILVGVITTVVIAFLALGQRSIAKNGERSRANETNIAVLSATTNERLEHIEELLKEIKGDLKEMRHREENR